MEDRKWCKKSLKNIIDETIFYYKRDNTNIIVFGGSFLDKIIIYGAIKFKDYKIPIYFEKENYQRKEKDYTIYLNQIEILFNNYH